MGNNVLFEIPLKNGFFLIGEKIEISNGFDENNTEIYISVIDENHVIIQDVVMLQSSDAAKDILKLFLWEEKYNEDTTREVDIPLLTKKEWEEINS